MVGVSATTEAGATTATTRDPNGALVGLRTGTGHSYYQAAGTNPEGAPGFSQTGAAVAACAVGAGVEYVINQP